MPEHTGQFYDFMDRKWVDAPLRPIPFPDMHTGIPVSHGPHLTKEQGKQLERLNEKASK